MRRLLLASLAFFWLLPAIPAPGATPPAPPTKAGPVETAPSKPAIAPAPPAPAAVDAEANRTLSESGQFSILGGTNAERSEIAKRSESLWKLFSKTTGLPAQWSHRIIVQIYDRNRTVAPERRAVGRVYPIEGGFRFEMNVLPDGDFRWDEYRRELTKLFLLSQIIAANPKNNIRDRLPPWMVTGLHTLLNYRQNGLPSEFFATLLNTRQMLSVSEVLKGVPSQTQDSVTSGVYSACSAALVQALLDQPNGRTRFQALLTDLGTTERDPQELLQQHFPSLRQEPGNLEKWWALQMANMSEQDRYVVFSLAETEKHLEGLLLIHRPEPEAKPAGPPPVQAQVTKKMGLQLPKLNLFRKPEVSKKAEELAPFEPVPLRSHELYLHLPWAKGALSDKRRQFALLQAQSFPLYESILTGYQQIVAELQDGQVKGLNEKFDHLELERQAILAQMRGVEDHINWFSTTQIEGQSHEFDGYAQAFKLLEKLEQRKRPDPISRYLDAIERELNP